MTNQAFPLSWPITWQRSKWPHASPFGRHTIAECVAEIQRQLQLLGASGVVISSNLQLRRDGLPMANQAQPRDLGVAVYFKFKKIDCVLACDRWDRVEANMWAIAKDIDAQRGRQRWGVGSIEQAFAGYTALPAAGQTSGEAWWVVLEVQPDTPAHLVRAAYHALAKRTHPDAGGSDEQFHRVAAAFEQFEQARKKEMNGV